MAWQYAVAGDGRRSTTSGTEEADEALYTFLRSGEATAGSVEVPLAGRADDGCDVTAYRLIVAGAGG